MSRRGENIRKRKDGRWEGRYIKGYDSKKQKARYASVYGKTYAETKQKLDEAKYKSSIGVVYVDAKNKLFGEIINSWFNAKKINLKPSSIIKYQNLIEKHILPELGHRKLRELNADLFYTFLDAQQKNGNKKNGGMLSTSSLQTMLYILNATIKYAASNNMVAYFSICLTRSGKEATPIQTLEQHEEDALDLFLSTHISRRNLGIMLASKWYLRAIENGNTFAEYQYGMKFALGMDGFEKDIQQAYKYLSHAAQAGQSYAMKPLAELLDDEYIPGLSMEDRNSQMIYWFERAVENGEEWAAVTLGRKYENGYTPVQVDVAKAINYYQIAADHDIDMVYLSLGKLYMIPGPTANYKMAHRYLSLAQEKATLDFQIAEIELCYGKMNKDGLGIPKNLEEAHKHFTIAAAKGNADAIEELKHIKKGLFGWKII